MFCVASKKQKEKKNKKTQPTKPQKTKFASQCQMRFVASLVTCKICLKFAEAAYGF